MKGVDRRVGRLETAAGTTGRLILVVVIDDGDGVWRDPQTGTQVVPPVGALVVVVRERSDGPQ
ncbi:MAG: hypothetical protein M3Q71_16980 [Chloroflexota bacterium]|nr:hypothetical protein [Chloroflexota bacterium]MDP9472335.1 hypothetical protein [Chloroflexota bacterium]